MNDVILTEDQKENLDTLVKSYTQAIEEYNVSEAKKNAFNLSIKETLKDYGITKYLSSNGFSIGISTRQNIKWNENALLYYCKTLNIDGLVKTKEYVDMDILEAAIYNNKIDVSSLKKFQIVKPDVVTLTCKESKKKQLVE